MEILGAAMAGPLGSTPLELRINLAIVRGHYADAARSHLRPRSRAAQFAAIRDIPYLVNEIERLFDVLAELSIHHAEIRDAALATIAANEIGDIDSLLPLRLALSSDGRRRWSDEHQR